MILDKVESLRPRIDVEIELDDGSFCKIRAVLDTGFNGYVGLPSRYMKGVKSKLLHARTSTLAAGRKANLPRYTGKAKFDGTVVDIEILDLGKECEGDPPINALVGTGLIKGCVLGIEMWNGGRVHVERVYNEIAP